MLVQKHTGHCVSLNKRNIKKKLKIWLVTLPNPT